MTIRKALTHPVNMEKLRLLSEPDQRMNRQVRQHLRDLEGTLAASEDEFVLAGPQAGVHPPTVVVCPATKQKALGKPGRRGCW